MKSKAFKLFIFLAGIGIILFAGCKKDVTTDKWSPVQKSNSAADSKISRMIETFRTECHTSLKDNKTMCIDSVLWYLMATANYSYGNASDSNTSISIDSAVIDMPKNSGTLSISQVSVLYDSLIAKVRTHYYSIDASNPNLLFVDVFIISGTSSIKVISACTYGGFVDPWDFHSWDNWYWGFLQGKCSPSSGGQGQDASTQLTQKFMARHGYPAPPCYWIPVTGIHERAVDFPAQSSPTNDEGYYMFWNDPQLPNYHECIPWTEMNFYLDGVEHVAYHAMYDLYPELEGTENMSASLHALYSYGNAIEHDGYFYYGVRHTGSLPNLHL